MESNRNIPRLPLSFKPKNIREFEKKHGAITDNLDINIDNLCNLISVANGNCGEDTSEEILDSFLEGGGDVIEALVQITEALEKKGFLPRDLAVSRMVRKTIKTKLKSISEEMEKEMGEDLEKEVGIQESQEEL